MALIATARLRLRPPTPEDLEAFAGLYADPAVMRFLKGVRARSEVEAALARMMASWETEGFGMWVAERAYRTRGFWPWPNTARFCGLLG